MGRKNGVSELIGKLMSCKSGGSAHSTQQCKTNKKETQVARPYMAEACGGCDDDTEFYEYTKCRIVGGLT